LYNYATELLYLHNTTNYWYLPQVINTIVENKNLTADLAVV